MNWRIHWSAGIKAIQFWPWVIKKPEIPNALHGQQDPCTQHCVELAPNAAQPGQHSATPTPINLAPCSCILLIPEPSSAPHRTASACSKRPRLQCQFSHFWSRRWAPPYCTGTLFPHAAVFCQAILLISRRIPQG